MNNKHVHADIRGQTHDENREKSLSSMYKTRTKHFQNELSFDLANELFIFISIQNSFQMSARYTTESLSTRVQKTPSVLSSRNQTSARAKTAMSTPRTIRIKTKSSTLRDKPSFMKRETEIYEEPEYLYDQFLKLNQEIAEIQCEVKPLRARFAHLQNEILAKQQIQQKDEDLDFIDPEDDNTIAKRKDFQSAIFKFQNECSQMQKQLQLIRQAFSPAEIKKLEQEEIEGKNLISTLKINITQMDETLDKYQTQLNQFKLSQLYDTVQRQKDEIQKVTKELQNEISKHEQLKVQRDIYQTDQENADTIAEDVNTIARLKRKLESTRRLHYEKCEIFLALRNKQLKEIEEVKSAIPRDAKLTNALSHIQSQEIFTPYP